MAKVPGFLSQNASRIVQERIQSLVAGRLVGIHQSGLERQIAALDQLLAWCHEEEEAIFQTAPRCDNGWPTDAQEAAHDAVWVLYETEFEQRLLRAIW